MNRGSKASKADARTSGGFTRDLEEFWVHVANAEQDVREYGHRGRLPPDWHGDLWSDELSNAYDAISPYLRKVQKDRFFRVPNGLAFRTVPIKAETAHQALMYFLNPPEELHGEPGVLESVEYKQLKSEAMAELHQLDGAREVRNDRPSSTRSAKKRSELVELRAVLLDHHFPKKLPFRENTLSSKEIEMHLGWSQPKVSKRMGVLFCTREGMAAYAAVFSSGSTPKGFRKRFDDSTIGVEALWTDRISSDDEVDETESE